MAKPVHKDSNDCSSSSLDLFLLPPTQSSFQKGKTIDYHPITSLTDGGPIEFKVSGSGKEFLDQPIRKLAESHSEIDFCFKSVYANQKLREVP